MSRDNFVMRAVIRPMTFEDLPGVGASATAAFQDLDIRLNRPVVTDLDPQREEIGRAILRQILTLDAGGAFVVAVDGAILGVAMAGLREGLWYLAQLHLAPAVQGRGLGRRLLEAALSYGADSRGMLLHSSLDPQAMRCYQRAGFTLEPALLATGSLRRSEVPATPRVRTGDTTDLDLVADIDRQLRGGPHGPDLELLLRMGAQLLVVAEGPHHGYALLRREPLIVAGTDTSTARELLWAALAQSPDGEICVRILRGDQQWAIDVAVRAGLQLAATGPLCRRRDTGPLAPYLPHPALL